MRRFVKRPIQYRRLMFRFFRTIRQSLLMENKTSKYFKYAIGEIVLVVLGILIALSINNWNETRKQKETTKAMYVIVKADLINDISEIDSFLKEYDEVRKPSFEAALNTKITKEDWLKNSNYTLVIRGFKDFSINERGSELLKNQSHLPLMMEQNLASEINLFYHQHIIEIDVAIRELGDVFTDNTKHQQGYDWFSSFILNNKMEEGAIEYVSNDPNAKNRIALYYVVFEIYATELRSFRENARELILKIDNQIKAN